MDIELPMPQSDTNNRLGGRKRFSESEKRETDNPTYFRFPSLPPSLGPASVKEVAQTIISLHAVFIIRDKVVPQLVVSLKFSSNLTSLVPYTVP